VLRAHIRRQVFPQAPSPTMTSLRRISAMARTHATHVSERSVCGMKDGFEGVESTEVGLRVGIVEG